MKTDDMREFPWGVRYSLYMLCVTTICMVIVSVGSIIGYEAAMIKSNLYHMDLLNISHEDNLKELLLTAKGVWGLS